MLRWNTSVNGRRQRRISAILGEPETPATDLVARLVERLGLPRRLRDVGIRREDLRAIAEHALHDAPIRANPCPIKSADDIMEILRLAR